MIKKFCIFIYFISSLTYSTCLFNDEKYKSIVWMDDSLSFTIADSFVHVSRKKYFLQGDVQESSKGVISFSKDGKYVKLTRKVQCKDCFPSIGMSFFELHSDTLKSCKFQSSFNEDALLQKLNIK